MVGKLIHSINLPSRSFTSITATQRQINLLLTLQNGCFVTLLSFPVDMWFTFTPLNPHLGKYSSRVHRKHLSNNKSDYELYLDGLWISYSPPKYPLGYHSIIFFSIVKTNFIKNIIKLASW